MKTKYKLFLKGEFSNWYISTFIVDGITFNCGEQYMMYKKAMLFNDLDTANKIMNTSSPSSQKKLGRKVKNYVEKEWDSVRYEIVKKGLIEKFTQNENLKRFIISHKGYQMVEVNPKDIIWGVGYSESDALENIDDWGQNLLGKILTEISNEI